MQEPSRESPSSELAEETGQKLDELRDKILSDLREQARLAIHLAIDGVLSSGDLTILSVLDIDGRVEMLDCFIEECNRLKKETADGTKDSRHEP